MDDTKKVPVADWELDGAVQPDSPAAAAELARVDRPAPRAQVVRPMAEARPQFERSVVRTSEHIGKLVAAIAQAQAEDGFGDIEKTKNARVTSRRTGQTFEYSYETLSDVLNATRPFFSKHGVAVMQFPYTGTATVTIRTMLLFEDEWISNDLAANSEGLDPQQVGGAISYLRRYALKSVAGVAADDEDDDAQAASAALQAARPKPAQRVSQQAEARPPAAERPSPTGRVAALDDRGTAALVTLDTGFRAQTRDAEIVKQLRLFKGNGATLELITEPSSDPAKYAPRIVDLIVVRSKE